MKKQPKLLFVFVSLMSVAERTLRRSVNVLCRLFQPPVNTLNVYDEAGTKARAYTAVVGLSINAGKHPRSDAVATNTELRIHRQNALAL